MRHPSQLQQVHVRLDDRLKAALDAESVKRRTTRSEAIRQILWEWHDNKPRETMP